jgi:hypothetical protein
MNKFFLKFFKKVKYKKNKITENKALKNPCKIKINKYFVRSKDHKLHISNTNIGVIDLYFNVFLKSSTLKYIHNVFKNKLNYKKAFEKVVEGINKKYNYKIEIVENNFVQESTKKPGNYATVDFKNKIIYMERFLFEGNWEFALKEIKHEFGYILLKSHYNSSEIPMIGSRYATHHLDTICDLYKFIINN